MSNETIGKGDICRAETDVLCTPARGGRRMVIEKGELVEFRYWSAAHVRTVDGLYLEIPEKEFYEKFRKIGRIFHDVCFRNSNTTKEIIDCRLYHEEKE